MKSSMLRTGFEAWQLLGDPSFWLISVEETDCASQLASILAITAAVFHASFAALQNGRDNPWISRAAIDVALFLLAWPIALFLAPWPHAEHIWLFVGVFVIHNVYKVFHGMTYARGAYTVVNSVVRGSSVLAIVIVSGSVFQEAHSIWQWSGVPSLMS
jgi:drug/metabolite transporter (DMT)-like permease